MIAPHRGSIYRVVFCLAAAYNICFGVWTALWPDAFFELSGLEPARYPVIWQCLGMVVGVYGLLYAWAARNLARGRPVIAVGLLGKVLGPAGWLVSIATGALPISTLPLIIFNDLIWWLPFGLYLLEDTEFGRRLRSTPPITCAALHAAALLAMITVLLPGTEVASSLVGRADYIEENLALWRFGWLLWLLSGISLLGFYAWWGGRIQKPAVALGALLIATAGFICDAWGEAMYISRLPGNLATISRIGSLLTGGAANGLYTLAGILLTLNTSNWRAGLKWSAWVVWAAGIGLSLSTFGEFQAGMLGFSAILFSVFIPWCVLMGRNLR